MKVFKSFKFAFLGILSCIKCERNFRVHMVAAITVMIFAYAYGVTKTEGAVLTVIICLVMSAELLNTAVEAIVDIVCPERSRLAKIAKDSAAGAVLVFAIGAVVIACFIFSDMERLMRVWEFSKKNIAFLTVYAIIGTYYILFSKTKG